MPTPPTPRLEDFVDLLEADALIACARLEDLGPDGQDVTSEAFISADRMGQGDLVARQAGRLAGLALLPRIAKTYDPSIRVELLAADADPARLDQTVARVSGPVRSLLAMERIALNFITHLSGVATLTARFVEKTAGTRAKIYDTRKTIPGLRRLQKYAVACGGGHTHRIGLYDAMLIKDNHLAGLSLDELAGTLQRVVREARQRYPRLKFIEVEVDRLDQLERVLGTGVDVVLLDNMTLRELEQAVALRDRAAPRVELEASGGVNLDTVAGIAATGVDRISAGALTHSAPALDLALDLR
ncbi:MAG TPA: carboxylating nicotinate-nucleotide diphosphorylase [Phycisphaeraceae bacterium]